MSQTPAIFCTSEKNTQDLLGKKKKLKQFFFKSEYYSISIRMKEHEDDWMKKTYYIKRFTVEKKEGFALPERPKVFGVLSENEVFGFLVAQTQTPQGSV